MQKDRHFPRLNLSCDMEYSIDTNAASVKPDTGNSKTKDISIGGLCFITDTELPIGTVLNMKFKLKSGEAPFSVKGKIIWSEQFDIGGHPGWDNGIQFIDISEDFKASILKYIDSML